MKNYTVYKTEEAAIEIAKKIALSKFINAEGFEEFGMKANETAILNDDAVWLVNNKSCQCNCGQTPAVEVTMFPKYLTNETLGFDTNELSVDSDDDQYYGFAGICENCGE